jgi:uncharacterized protein
VTAQTDLTVNTAGFPGYEGTAVFPADASGQWMSVLRFRTGHQLTAWLGSRERQEALPQLRDHLIGLMPWLAVFIANVASVALLTWVLVPAASRPLRRWLDPVDGEAPPISVVGAAAVVLSYTMLLLIFALL